MTLEYICEECGCLLLHSNPNTLESMTEIHKQLCTVKRQRLLSSQTIRSVPQQNTIPQTQTNALPTSNNQTQSIVETSPASSQLSQNSGNTTISLTGTGTDHSVMSGPIDVSFKNNRQKAGKFQGITVTGPIDPPGQLGIWGDSVCVDFDICIGDGACIDACPVNVYEWLDTPGHPGSEKKPFMIREKDCIFCLACENVCPPQAIKIFQKT